jgi:hypothetical protein
MATQLQRDSAPLDRLEAADRKKQSVLTLLHRLTRELARLLRQEIALATAEFIQTAGRALTALTTAAAGGVVLFAGLLVLLAAAVLGLSQVMAPWLAALIVGIVVSVVGIVALLGGTRSLPETLRAKRTARSIAKDKDVLTRKTS